MGRIDYISNIRTYIYNNILLDILLKKKNKIERWGVGSASRSGLVRTGRGVDGWWPVNGCCTLASSSPSSTPLKKKCFNIYIHMCICIHTLIYAHGIGKGHQLTMGVCDLKVGGKLKG